LLLKPEYANVPVAWKLPVRVEESETAFPRVTDEEESKVASVGLALFTVRDSHGLVAPLLLASPEYTAFQLYDPGELNVCDMEFGTNPLATVIGVPTVVAVPLQTDPVKNS